MNIDIPSIVRESEEHALTAYPQSDQTELEGLLDIRIQGQAFTHFQTGYFREAALNSILVLF